MNPPVQSDPRSAATLDFDFGQILRARSGFDRNRKDLLANRFHQATRWLLVQLDHQVVLAGWNAVDLQHSVFAEFDVMVRLCTKPWGEVVTLQHGLINHLIGSNVLRFSVFG
ncbi:hypothetical protein [Novipirellula artificiosorum]|uniref:Uncharacterized protein n=1 Tax=Novipirellula artificiosorum TaxID=2528016 RepID=A0A5C6DDX5_9BACT|nr:hypothetical protein [Novipirellula artificiosorum]TWU33911.1 hypothetical protein Poly41_49110 [Novipirellula artificiosorum]